MKEECLFLSMNSSTGRFMCALKELDNQLAHEGFSCELCLVADQIVGLLFRTKPGSLANDRVPEAVSTLRKLEAKVEEKQQLPANWLTEAAKQYLLLRHSLLDLQENRLPQFTNLTIESRSVDYVMAMKCRATGSSRTSSSEEMREIRFLINCLRFRTPLEVFCAIAKYYPPEKISTAAQHVIKNLSNDNRASGDRQSTPASR
jgi:hypothetical protein